MSVVRQLWARRLIVGVVLLVHGVVFATTVVLFAVNDRLLFRPLPYPEADRIVHVEVQRRILLKSQAERDAIAAILTAETVFQDRAFVGSGTVLFEHSAAVREWGFRYAAVTPEFFALFGGPILGRALDADDVLSTPRSMVISHDLWRRAFGARDDVIGTSIEIPSFDPRSLGSRWRIVGVMPSGFEVPAGANVWVPHDGPRTVIPGFRPGAGMPTFARLAPGLTVEQVSTRLPDVTLTPLKKHLTPAGGGAFLYLGIAALLVLASCWVQMAGITASRVAARSRETTIRAALGGTRWQVVRPIALEAVVLTGGVLAVALSLVVPMAGLVAQVLPPEFHLESGLWLRPRPLLFAFGLLGVGAAVLALVPAAAVVRLGFSTAAVMTIPRFRATPRSHQVLIGTHVAVSVLLTYLAGLAWHSSRAMGNVDLGFGPARLIAVRLPPLIPPTAQRSEDRMLDVQNQQFAGIDALQAVRSMIGVEAATLASRWPLQRPGATLQSLRPNAAADAVIEVRNTAVSDDYFSVIGARLIEGRGFTPSDARGSVAIVDRALAERLQPFGSVIGSRISAGNQTYQIVGVIENMVHERPDERHQPEMFRNVTSGSVLLARLARDAPARTPEALLAHLVAIWGEERAPRTLVSLEDEARRAHLPYVAQQVLLGALAAVTLLALVAGLLSTVALVLQQKRWDLGIRYALGAGRGAVRGVVWREMILIVAGGAVAGLVGGWAAGRVVGQHWYGVVGLGPATAWAVVALLASLIAAAIEWPVRRFEYVSPFLAVNDD